MPSKRLFTFLLALTFLFLFSGSSSAGLFSPDDWTECVFKNLKNIKNDEFTPYIFNDGKLVGIGWTMLGGAKSQGQTSH